MNYYKVELEPNKTIEFQLLIKNVKNINLTIRPDFSIMVSANENVPIDEVYTYIESKSH